MNIRELLESYLDEKLERLMLEHIEWEKNGYLKEDALLRSLAQYVYNSDLSLHCERIAFEVFRVYALRKFNLRNV